MIGNSLNGSVLQDVIPDPGDTAAIPVTMSGTCPIVTGGAETRTLAAPTFAGQVIRLAMDYDGGDATVTCATTVNQSANNTMTFGEAGDAIVLHGVKVGSSLLWKTLGNDGVALSTA